MLQVSGREPGFPSSTVKTFRLPGRIVGGRGARGEGWDLGTADAPAVFDSETRRRGVARFNVGNNERVKLLVGFCLFVPRGVWESAPAAYGSLGPPRTPHLHQTDPQPDPARTPAEHHRTLPNLSEQHRTPPNPAQRPHIGFHTDLELGCDDLEYSWRLRRSGFELLLARDVFVSHACRVSFSRAGFETAKKVAEADTAMHGILNEAYAETVDRVGLFGFDPLG